MYVNALICMCATHNEYKHVKTDFMYMYIVYRRRQWQPTPILLPGKSHGWRSLVGCSPWGLEELDMTE